MSIYLSRRRRYPIRAFQDQFGGIFAGCLIIGGLITGVDFDLFDRLEILKATMPALRSGVAEILTTITKT